MTNDLSEQYKRKIIVTTERRFPYLKKRLLVTSTALARLYIY